MAGVFDLFKKNQSSSGANSAPIAASPTQDAQSSITTNSTTTTSQTAESAMPIPSSYNGIGNPQSGKAYSGIGSPPSGQVYSGIGNPPASKVADTTAVQQPVIAQQDEQKKKIEDMLDETGGQAAKPADQSINASPANQQKPQDRIKNDSSTSNTKPSNDPKSIPDDASKKQTDLDLMTHLTQRSNRVFVTAQNKAKEFFVEFVDSEHILHGLLSDPEIYKLFTDIKVLPQIIEEELTKVYKKGGAKQIPQFSPRVKRILENSLVVARKVGYEFISPEHILLSLYEEGEGAGARILIKLGVKKEDLNKKIVGKKEGIEGEKGATDGGKKSVLSQYTNDLTEKAAQGLLDPVVERSEVIERAIHILSRRTKNNPALVGEAGVGKTAIVEGLAQKIVKKEVPEPLMDKKILQLDLMSLVAGASHRGEFEERMKKLIEEVVASKGQIILFIDEIHNLVGAGSGSEGSLDASNFLKPSLARGELQLIGATTLTEYRKYIEKDPALERRFQPVLVPEPTEEAAIKMLKATRDKYEAFHRVKIPDDAIETAVKLSKRYVGDRFLPDKAVDLIDEAGSAVRLPLISLPEVIRSAEERIAQLKQEKQEAEKAGNNVKSKILAPKIDDLEADLAAKKDEYESKKGQTTTSVTPQIIKDIIARWTGIPVSKITDSEVEKLTKLEDIMHERLINQESAVTSVAQAVRRGRAGLKSNNRPIGGFVFLGPTGVGKTELAKTLAEILFGQEEAMIRLDMTEFMEKHEVAKLLGAPPGYVGYEEGGKLTEAVRRKPYSVVLFDEIEKAHPDIFNILLQVLDDGRLTDNKGHTISFKNTVVICTSNIGTKTIQDEILTSGQVQVEEPPVLSTYTFSPRGREMMTIMGKVFERDSNNSQWQNKMLLDYFSGQQIESQDEKHDAVEFPNQGFDTHTISQKGVEVITAKDKVFYRTSTTSKVWNIASLIEYFKDAVVINALPDAPEQQLPTARLKTHAFSTDEWEFVSFQDRFWKRKEGSTNWETGALKDYFANQTLEVKGQKTENSKTPATTDNKQDKPQKAPAKTEGKWPTSYWDIHSFSPTGTEMIIVGQDVWIKENGKTVWMQETLKDYFAANFPLDKELEEKAKIESELSKNKYEKTKGKVMEELRSFMRPELINRFDEVIVFEPLKYQHMLKIAALQLKALRKLLEEQNIGLEWTDDAAKEIVRVGFDPIYGARPLKRTIQKLIENPISTLLIEQKVTEGDQIVVHFDGDNFVFNIEKVELVAEDKLGTATKKKFFCEKCGANFETEIVKNSTPVCKACGSKNIKEVVAEETMDTSGKKLDDQKKDTPDHKEEVKTESADQKQLEPTMPKPDMSQTSPTEKTDDSTKNQSQPSL